MLFWSSTKQKRKRKPERKDGRILEMYTAQMFHAHEKRNIVLNQRYSIRVHNGPVIYSPQVDVEYTEGMIILPRRVAVECKNYARSHPVDGDAMLRFAVKTFFLKKSRYEVYTTSYYDLEANVISEFFGIPLFNGIDLKERDNQRRWLFGRGKSVDAQLGKVDTGKYDADTSSYKQGETKIIELNLSEAEDTRRRMEKATKSLNDMLRKYSSPVEYNLIKYVKGMSKF